MGAGVAASVDQLTLVTPVSGAFLSPGLGRPRGEGRRWPEAVCAGARREGPRGEASFVRRTPGGYSGCRAGSRVWGPRQQRHVPGAWRVGELSMEAFVGKACA